MIPLSVVIIAFNEEWKILRCLQPVEGIADEILVLDSNSKDSTKEICIQNHVKFYGHPVTGFNVQKNHALSLASNPCTLSLGADKALSPAMKKPFLSVKENWQSHGYSMNRMTNYCGTWMKQSRYYDTRLRLLDTSKGYWDDNIIHEKIMIKDGTTAIHLAGDILNYLYNTFDNHFARLRRFTKTGAVVAFNNKKITSNYN